MTRGRLAAVWLAAGMALPAAADLPVPPLTGPVVDRAGVLDAQWRARLERLSREARAEEGGSGPQLQYLLVDSLDGEPIESFSIRVAEAWKIGSRGKDNGVLVVVAVGDHRVRIEVGGGVEGGLTDAQASRIIRNTLAPAFRAGRYGEGLYGAGRQILAALGALPQGASEPQAPVGRRIPIPFVGALLGTLLGLGAPFIVFVVLFLVVVRLLGGFGRGRRGPWDRWGGGGFGGGGGWSGGGGGGWSGGGGGFSGGGASGSW
ncbi:MAG TPA: TPM domain-containing protein [Anaeromyxobacteraceae bacterium]|nr:TPM domain-containing protein [Anaeromyxobacteraceae bacterium]